MWDTERRVTTPARGLGREVLDPPSCRLHQPRPADPSAGTTDSWAKEPLSGRGRLGSHGSRGELPEAPFLPMTPWESGPNLTVGQPRAC